MHPFRISETLKGYNLDVCEERILVDAWFKIRGRIPPAETWAQRFEDKFFRSEKGISEYDIKNINGHLQRLNQPTLPFFETDKTPSMTWRHQMRIDSRSDIYDEMKSPQRDAILISAHQELVQLPPLLDEHEVPKIDLEALAKRRREETLERIREEQERAAEAVLLAERAEREAQELAEKEAEAAAALAKAELDASTRQESSASEILLMRIVEAVEGINQKFDIFAERLASLESELRLPAPTAYVSESEERVVVSTAMTVERRHSRSGRPVLSFTGITKNRSNEIADEKGHGPSDRDGHGRSYMNGERFTSANEVPAAPHRYPNSRYTPTG